MARKKKDKDIEDDNISDLNEYFKSQLESQDLDDVESFVSTGSTLLDYAISNKENGGIPTGRITEISGNEASGKSLIAYHILSNVQKMGGVGVYIDTERSGNKEFMIRVGIDWDKLIYVRDLQCIEDVFNFIEKVAKITRIKISDKSKPVVIVWDSVASTQPKDSLEADYDKPGIGLAARAMSRGLSKINEALNSGYITLLCINQLRTKIGVLFGDNSTTPHGKALPFYSSVRVKLGGTQKILDNQNDKSVVGVMCNAKVFKNKVGPNWRTASFPLMYDYGINDAQSIFQYLFELKEIQTAGPYKKMTVGEEEYKFFSADWRSIYNKPNVKEYVSNILKERMIIKFKGMPDDIEVDENSNIDSESYMEIDQLKQDME